MGWRRMERRKEGVGGGEEKERMEKEVRRWGEELGGGEGGEGDEWKERERRRR